MSWLGMLIVVSLNFDTCLTMPNSKKAHIFTTAQIFLATALDIKLIGVSTYSSVRFINVKHTNV